MCVSWGKRYIIQQYREKEISREILGKALPLQYHGSALAEKERPRKNRMGRPKYSNVMCYLPICPFH